MLRSRQAVHTRLRVKVSRAVRHQALVPVPAEESRQLALIRGYQAMALINREIVRVFTPCEEEAEQRLTQFRQR
ncbi:hypothetical protein VC81_05430 [Levilactobacillus spicheri]|jgi:hypothetical protein|uniref:Uncharacterized protein n=1 Tax=Levilactobacillus spicheri TaxID=216463 RepID=A0A0F3RTK7_9LACO|nr:hypothetical protein VC81_05430 [Levilactobacillus spicheri]GEO67365.1 hypothetical protein LSP04_17840 [Levilactobacillus spicheri]